MANIEQASTNWHNFAEQGSAIDTPAAGTVNQGFYPDEGMYVVDDTGAEHPVALFTQDMFIPVTDMFPSTTAGCAALAQVETASNKQNYKTLDFDQTTQEHAEFAIWMPPSWNAGTISFQVVWTAAAGSAAQTVIWGLQARAYADGDAIDQAWGTAITVSDALDATGDIHYSSNSSALTVGGTPATGEMVFFRIYRDISDTLAADAKLLGIRLYWTR